MPGGDVGTVGLSFFGGKKSRKSSKKSKK
jgi:hypothetical protein